MEISLSLSLSLFVTKSQFQMVVEVFHLCRAPQTLLGAFWNWQRGIMGVMTLGGKSTHEQKR
jgi:hypothetical protein